LKPRVEKLPEIEKMGKRFEEELDKESKLKKDAKKLILMSVGK
jgi:hypothetical protein